MGTRLARLVLLALALLAADGCCTRAGADPSLKPTLEESDAAAIDAALGDKLAQSINQNVYISTQANVASMESNRFVRNTDLWIGPQVDLTAIAAYNTRVDSYGTKFEITAISPIHCLGAAHVNLAPGTKLNFVGKDNKTYTRRVIASTNPVDDVDVYLLDSELPPSVTPMAVLPGNWAKYLPARGPMHLPVIFINQDNKLYVGEGYGITPGPNPQVFYQAPSTEQRRAFGVLLRSGDSSFPEMVVIKNQAVILSTFHFGGFGAGPLESTHFDAINTAMHKLSSDAGLRTDYQLGAANLKGIAKL